MKKMWQVLAVGIVILLSIMALSLYLIIQKQPVAIKPRQMMALPDYEREAKLILEGECGAMSLNEKTRFKTYKFEGDEEKGEYTLSIITTFERGNKYFFYFIGKGENGRGHYFIHTAHAAKNGIPPFNILRAAWEHALDEEGNASFLLMLDPRPWWSRLSDCKTWRPWDKQ